MTQFNHTCTIQQNTTSLVVTNGSVQAFCVDYVLSAPDGTVLCTYSVKGENNTVSMYSTLALPADFFNTPNVPDNYRVLLPENMSKETLVCNITEQVCNNEWLDPIIACASKVDKVLAERLSFSRYFAIIQMHNFWGCNVFLPMSDDETATKMFDVHMDSFMEYWDKAQAAA